MVARGVLAVMAVATLMGLTACGTATAGSAGTSSAGAGSAGHSASVGPGGSQSAAATVKAADGTVCTDTKGVDQVKVARTSSSSSRQVTLSGAIQVRALATALCALPALPSGQSCPATSGDSVRLVFADGQQNFPPVSIQVSGCRSVTGVEPARSWSASSQFGQLLSEAAGGVGRLNPGTHPSSVPTGP